MNTLHPLLATFNRLLPFSNPSTPLLQDIVHTLILCSLLYYAPQISEWYHRRRRLAVSATSSDGGPNDLQNVDFPEGHDGGIPPPTPEPSNEGLNNRHIEQGQREQQEDIWQDNNGMALENDAAVFAEAGPANEPQQPRPRDPNRAVGPKKAKSLARKDQRRAYHEFMRSQGDAQRAREAAEAKEREAEVEAERQRRDQKERELQMKAILDREKRKEKERKEKGEEMEQQNRVIAVCRGGLERRGYVDLEAVARKEGMPREKVERLARAAGLVNAKKTNGELVMVTKSGWLVKINGKLMEEVYKRVLEATDADGGNGKVTFENIGTLLEKQILKGVKS